MAGAVWLAVFAIACSFVSGQSTFLSEPDLPFSEHVTSQTTSRSIPSVRSRESAVLRSFPRLCVFPIRRPIELLSRFRKYADWDFGRGLPSFSGPINSLRHFRGWGADR